MQPVPPHGSPKKGLPAWALALLLATPVVLLFVAFLAIWQFLAPADRRVATPYSTFLEDVHEGRVKEIRVHNREITYRLIASSGKPGDASVFRETIGPVPDQAFLDTLKPTDPKLPPPLVTFDK